MVLSRTETSRIRRACKLLRDEANLDDAKRHLIEEIYRFKCPRIGCIDFTTGFNSRLARDRHLNRHNRPFVFVEQDCSLQALGFEAEAQLERHLARNHVRDYAD